MTHEKLRIMLELTFRSGFAKGMQLAKNDERVSVKQVGILFEKHMEELNLQIDRISAMQSQQKEATQ